MAGTAAAPARIVRHWRQRFDPAAEFVWIRSVQLTNDRRTAVGERVDKAALPVGKLRVLWNVGWIALAEE